MSQQTISATTVVTRAGVQTPRDRMWAAMRKLQRFSTTQVLAQVGTGPAPLKLDRVQGYMEGLRKAGYLREVQAVTRGARGRLQAAVYELVPGMVKGAAPWVNDEGRVIEGPVITTAMWRAMKIRRVFNAEQIADDASQFGFTCSASTALKYLKALAAVGYLVKGSSSRQGLFKLVKDTGPLPPAITRTKCVFDRNTGAVLPTQTAQEVCDALA